MASRSAARPSSTRFARSSARPSIPKSARIYLLRTACRCSHPRAQSGSRPRHQTSSAKTVGTIAENVETLKSRRGNQPPDFAFRPNRRKLSTASPACRSCGVAVGGRARRPASRQRKFDDVESRRLRPWHGARELIAARGYRRSGPVPKVRDNGPSAWPGSVSRDGAAGRSIHPARMKSSIPSPRISRSSVTAYLGLRQDARPDRPD